MAATDVEYGVHTRIKFECGKCELVSNATIRQSSEQQTDLSPAESERRIIVE